MENNNDYKKAAAILVSIQGKYPLSAEEKEAVGTAIGVLAWAALSKSSIKRLKAKRDKAARW